MKLALNYAELEGARLRAGVSEGLDVRKFPARFGRGRHEGHEEDHAHGEKEDMDAVHRAPPTLSPTVRVAVVPRVVAPSFHR